MVVSLFYCERASRMILFLAIYPLDSILVGLNHSYSYNQKLVTVSSSFLVTQFSSAVLGQWHPSSLQDDLSMEPCGGKSDYVKLNALIRFQSSSWDSYVEKHHDSYSRPSHCKVGLTQKCNVNLPHLFPLQRTLTIDIRACSMRACSIASVVLSQLWQICIGKYSCKPAKFCVRGAENFHKLW